MIDEQLKSYFISHGINSATFARCGLKCEGKVASIPIKDEEGNVLFWKHRHFEGPHKYTYDKGSTMSLFGLQFKKDWRLYDTIYITEGEMDAMALLRKGLRAVSTTGGSMSWKPEWIEHFKDVHPVIIYDRDKAGAEGAYKVWEALSPIKGRVYLSTVPFGVGKDIGDYVSKPEFAPHPLMLLDIGKKDSSTKENLMKSIRSVLASIDYHASKPDTAKLFGFIFEAFRKNLVEELRYLQKPKVHKVDGQELEKLKMVPITNFIHFKHGMANCLFHEDSRPSMIYNDDMTQYPNTVKCFSCGAFGSVIDVVMKLENTDFKGALKILREKHTV